MSLQVTILAAGLGTRLGKPFPKPLTTLRDGRTILQQQVDNIRGALPGARIHIVVGFKLEMILEAVPDALFVYNEEFDRTNTSKSLLRALRASGPGGMLWLNGDVVFDIAILKRLMPYFDADESIVSVNTSTVAEEEVKYTVDDDGYINKLSKQVQNALGEAVGINFIAGKDKEALIARLVEVDDQEYFEGGIEAAIAKDGIKVRPVDISDLYAVEVDFAEDLARANTFVPDDAQA